MLSNRLDTKNEKYFKCSCELFIQDFKVTHSGYLYMIWISGNKQTQTLKYDSVPSTSIQVGQTLILNLKLCSKNGKFIQKKSNLYLLNDQGQQLDDIQLNVNQWPASYKQMSLPIGGGSMHAKVRRRQIMQVQNMQEQDDDNMIEQINKSMIRGKMTQQSQGMFVRSQQKSFYLGN